MILRTTTMSIVIAVALAGNAGAQELVQSADDAQPLEIREVVRIGGFDILGEPFSRIWDAAVSDDGRIYVAEGGEDPHLRIYSPEGIPLRRIDGPEFGAGEFGSILGFGVRGDSVWVVDSRNSRVVLLDLDGELIADLPFSPISGGGAEGHFVLRPGKLRADGRWLSSAVYEVGAEGRDFQILEVLYDELLAVLDTVRALRVVFPPFRVEVDSLQITGQYLLPDSPMFLHGDFGTVMVERSAASGPGAHTFSVVHTDPMGDAVFHTTLSYSPKPVNDTHLDNAAAGLAAANSPPPVLERAREVLRIALPEFFPPATGLHVADDGTIWIRRESDSDRPRFLVLEASGPIRGQVEFPPGALILWSHSGAILTSEPTDRGNRWLVLYEEAAPILSR